MLLFVFVGWYVLKRRIESVPAGTFRELRNYPVRSRFQRLAVFGPCETLSGLATRDILQSLTAESFGDLGQGGSLRIPTTGGGPAGELGGCDSRPPGTHRAARVACLRSYCSQVSHRKGRSGHNSAARPACDYPRQVAKASVGPLGAKTPDSLLWRRRRGRIFSPQYGDYPFL